MSSTAEVLVQGLVLWWMTAPGPYAVIPDFTASANPHVATIMMRSSEYAGGNCPAGFTSALRMCMMTLSEAKKPGGVSITFAKTAASSLNKVPTASFCPIPRLQDAGTPFVLRPEFTPPAGSANAGWVRFEGGDLTSLSPCGDRDCARSVKWTPGGQEITLTLGNLANRNEPLIIPLPADVRVQVSNRPSGNHPGRDHLDWCLYFSMVTNAAAADISCPGRPAVPQCGLPTPTASSKSRRSFETIACSNSQYP